MQDRRQPTQQQPPRMRLRSHLTGALLDLAAKILGVFAGCSILVLASRPSVSRVWIEAACLCVVALGVFATLMRGVSTRAPHGKRFLAGAVGAMALPTAILLLLHALPGFPWLLVAACAVGVAAFAGWRLITPPERGTA